MDLELVPIGDGREMHLHWMVRPSSRTGGILRDMQIGRVQRQGLVVEGVVELLLVENRLSLRFVEWG